MDLLGYPVLMTADIVLYKADIVPVGVDQAPHLEFAREIVRSFNYRYNTKVLIEPQVKHTEVLKGARHRWQSQDEQEPEQPHRARLHARRDNRPRQRNGHRPCPYEAHRSRQPGYLQCLFDAQDLLSRRRVEMVNVECRRAGIGCVDCKKLSRRKLEHAP